MLGQALVQDAHPLHQQRGPSEDLGVEAWMAVVKALQEALSPNCP